MLEDLDKSHETLLELKELRRKQEEFQRREEKRAEICKLVPPDSGTAKDLGCDNVNKINEIPIEKK